MFKEALEKSVTNNIPVPEIHPQPNPKTKNETPKTPRPNFHQGVQKTSFQQTHNLNRKKGETHQG